MLNGVEVDESEIHRCLFILQDIQSKKRSKFLWNMDKPNNLRVVTYEND